jgi:hypothetical protein
MIEALRVLLIVAGLVVCFRGYSTFRLALALTAFLVGAHGALQLSHRLPAEPPWLVPVVIASAGLLVAAVVVVAWRVGVILLGMVLATLAALQALELYPTSPSTRTLVLVGAAVAGALLARHLERVALSLATACYGALMVISAAFGVSGAGAGRSALQEISHGRLTTFTLLWLALAAIGFLAQLTRSPRGEGGRG